MRENKHLWITFNPQKGDPREVIIDEENKDLRVCDGMKVVKVRFDGEHGEQIRDVLENDILLGSVVPLGELYNNVERVLSHALQPPGMGHREIIDEIEKARNNVRQIMRKMGWKGPF